VTTRVHHDHPRRAYQPPMSFGQPRSCLNQSGCPQAVRDVRSSRSQESQILPMKRLHRRGAIYGVIPGQLAMLEELNEHALIKLQRVEELIIDR
jgi:hypothetical protein